MRRDGGSWRRGDAEGVCWRHTVLMGEETESERAPKVPVSATPMAASRPFPGSLCAIQLLFLLLGILGVVGQPLEVLQFPGSVSVSAGQTLTLNCTLRGIALPRAVRWHKGSDRRQPPIYSQREPFSPRVTRVVPESNTDFTIRITDIQPEDAGTYFCVKYRLTTTRESEEKSGAGTAVAVAATPSQPVITAPSGRVAPGTTVTFNCSTSGFYPRDITVTWFKGSSEIKASDTDTVILPREASVTYQVWSTVTVQLSREDLTTQLLCRIRHETVQGTLEQSSRLADVLRVPPKVQVETSPSSPVKLNTNVTVTCHAQGFYPNETSLNLFDVYNKTETGKAGPLTQNQDGTFSVKSSLELVATEERNMSTFTCLVEHNSQPPTNGTVTLVIKVQAEESDSPNSLPGSSTNIYIIVAVVCALLVMLVVAVIYFIQVQHKKGKDPTSVRLHESEKASAGMNQDPDPNNVTYADLNFDKAPPKNPPQVVDLSQQSEYASIQTGKPAANDDNVTYADLDMVQLSKGPKRPAPQPEQAGSEYASVQVQSK